jgi:hypothetical protein
MKTILIFFSLLILLCQAGYQYDLWLGISPSCTGTPYYSYKAEGDCGLTTGQSKYVKVTYEASSGDYFAYEYEDQACTKENSFRRIKKDEVNTCVATFLYAYKFQIFFICFPGEAQVTLENNERVQLNDLKVGDSIATYGGNSPSYSEVYTFIDYQKDIYLDFLELQYLEESGKQGKIALSHEHLIMAKRFGEAKFVQAKDVRVGDYIFKSFNGTVSPVIISSIRVAKYKGALAPATMDGTVIVNDIVVSSYAAASHNVVHAVFAPLRFAYKIAPSLVSYDLNGMHPYAKFLFDGFSNWAQHPNYLYAAPTLDS